MLHGQHIELTVTKHVSPPTARVDSHSQVDKARQASLLTQYCHSQPLAPTCARTACHPTSCQVREFAAKMIAPHAEEVDRTNNFPTSVDLWREMGSFGLLGVTAPPEYGGLGLGYAEHCIAMEEISRASGAVGLSYGEQGGSRVRRVISAN